MHRVLLLSSHPRAVMDTLWNNCAWRWAQLSEIDHLEQWPESQIVVEMRGMLTNRAVKVITTTKKDLAFWIPSNELVGRFLRDTSDALAIHVPRPRKVQRGTRLYKWTSCYLRISHKELKLHPGTISLFRKSEAQCTFVPCPVPAKEIVVWVLERKAVMDEALFFPQVPRLIYEFLD